MTAPPSFRLRDPRQLLALGFGAGLAPGAPGTAGTLVAVPLAWGLDAGPWPLQAAVLLAGFLAGVYICGATTRAAGVHDHPAIVWDEIIGYLLTLSLVPASALNLALGFVLFRVLDIAKPWPVRALDRRVTGGLGIMLDDAAAGAMAALALLALHRLLGGA